MIVNNSQSIQSSSNPLDTSSTRRVRDVTRASNLDADDKQAEEVQKQQDDKVLRELRARDREVRAHEAAHTAAGGSLVRGGPSFSYQTGPDGRSYAVGGEVQLDVSPVANDPQATINKASQIRAAALAPANPSSQDIRVASNANQLAARARVDLAIQRREELKLEENQQTLDEASRPSGADSNSDSPLIESQTVPPAASPGTSDNLQSNEPPAAAISAFMATAQTERTSVLFNQFA